MSRRQKLNCAELSMKTLKIHLPKTLPNTSTGLQTPELVSGLMTGLSSESKTGAWPDGHSLLMDKLN